MKRIQLTIALLLISCATGHAQAASPPAALDRIGVVDGIFVNQTTGEPFTPRGVNYIRLNGWHAVFRPGSYDAQRAEAMLADLSRRGFNTVRVFINNNHGYVVADADADELNEPYMNNVIDFLERATRHHIHVILSLQYVPFTPRFVPQFFVSPEAARELLTQMAPIHTLFLHEKGIAGVAAYYQAFVQWIATHAPHLLPTVLAYEMSNEMYLLASEPPFGLDEGTFTGLTGRTYDLSSDEEKQQLADDHTLLLVEAAVAAIAQVDPDAMVNANVYTFDAVGRSGPAAFSRDVTPDRRFPVRALTLTQTPISYLDIHLYALTEENLARQLKSAEFELVRQRAAERGMPIIMGEFGVFRHEAETAAIAAELMADQLRRVQDLGFQGYLYWTYDTDEQAYLWNARSEDDAILNVLTQFNVAAGTPSGSDLRPGGSNP